MVIGLKQYKAKEEQGAWVVAIDLPKSIHPVSNGGVFVGQGTASSASVTTQT